MEAMLNLLRRLQASEVAPRHLLLGSLGVFIGCGTQAPVQSANDAQLAANHQEQSSCSGQAMDPRLYSASIVQNVAPLYEYVQGGPNDREAHLWGAELQLRPLAGVTMEFLARTLMCRSAQLTLGHAAPASNEPYFLPDGWVTVSVRSGAGTFVVRLASGDPGQGREILRRARAFAGGTDPSPHPPP
jgi:hypothetical protein